MENNSHLTAITRKHISKPTKYLLQHNLLEGRILDFGCGKGFDVDFLQLNGFDITGYDPYFRPEIPNGLLDTVICNYVINVLEERCQENVLNTIKAFLTNGGFAYIAVRRDVKNEGYTKRGTFQRNVELNLPILTENSKFCVYLFVG